MIRGKYRRLHAPQTVTYAGRDIVFNQWHCFEFIETVVGGQFTQAKVKDTLGRIVELRFNDLGLWNAIYMLEKDYGSLYVGETVDLLDPTTSDGETIIVSDKGNEVRVPVDILTPVERHLWKAAFAV